MQHATPTHSAIQLHAFLLYKHEYIECVIAYTQYCTYCMYMHSTLETWTESWAECACCAVPGSLSRVVMNAMLGEIISTVSGWSVEVITTTKYSDSSVVLSSMVDTIKVADI